jgi:hypothetical protein
LKTLIWTVAALALAGSGAHAQQNTDPSFAAHPDYFLGGKQAAAQIPVLAGDQLMPVGQIAPADLPAVREHLETLWETDPSSVTGGEDALRKMLRAIRAFEGPNEDPARAFHWTLNAVVVPNIDIHWTDASGAAQHYQATVGDVGQWVQWIAREMQFLRQIIFVASWGKIWLEGQVAVATVPVTDVVNIDGAFFVDPLNAERVFESALPGQAARGWMAWLSTDGTGQFPPSGDIAYTFTNNELMNGANLTAIMTSEQRLMTPHGWARTDCCGLMHEFWQHVHQWTSTTVGFQGFVPDNDTRADVTNMLHEIQAQGLPAPYTFYADFFGTYPLRNMLEQNVYRP